MKKLGFKKIISRLLMLDLLKGMALTFRYNLKALAQPRGVGGNPNKGIYTEWCPEERP